LSGIKAGEQVVISGQFLIDSEANLQTGLSRLGEKESKP
jgi:Cu(I)/Ag(I) efflux system membrane fusion protein